MQSISVLIVSVSLISCVFSQDPPSCNRYDSLQRKMLRGSPFSLVSDAQKTKVMNKAPKTFSEDMVEAILVQYNKQLNENLLDVRKACRENKNQACGEFMYTLAQLQSNPPLFLPQDVEDALIDSLPQKATPLLLKLIHDEYFDYFGQEVNDLAYDCVGGGVDNCRRFKLENGNVKFGRDAVNATVSCSSGYKARTGDSSVDLTSASQSIFITCLPNGKWDYLPNCYQCEYGWKTSKEVPGCYRRFPGVNPYHSFDEYKRVCNKHKGDLLSIHSMDEMQFVANSFFGYSGSAMVGLQANENGEYLWSDGTTLNSNEYWLEEPSDEDQKCASLIVEAGQFGLLPEKCDEPITTQFLCKRVPTKKIT